MPKGLIKVAMDIIKCTPSDEYKAQKIAVATLNRKIASLEFKTQTLKERET